jgi:hypothetical protein
MTAPAHPSRTVAAAVSAALVCAALAVTLAAGCAGQASPAGTVRFHNQPPIWVVNDRKNVPKKPAENKFFRALYHFDGVWHGRLDRWMQMRRQYRAQNVNSLDEVPDSTWFTNRIGVRDLSVEEIKNGPNQTGTPENHRPWVIQSSKIGGVTVGFIILDQRGVRYVLKFDEKGVPELETGADVVQQRLFWAAGFNVPEDHIVYFKRSDLVRAPDAVIKDAMGNDTPMNDAFIDRQLATINVEPDGTIRGLVSQFIPGKPLGGHARDGVREDDPNDTIPHQFRRELRGTYAIYAWMDQTDVKEDNTLDTYVQDTGNPDVHYVEHYLIDFGKGLGSMGYINQRHWVSFSHIIDFGQTALATLTLGLYRRPWEGRTEPDFVGAGIFESKKYDPGSWKPYTPAYYPFHDADRFDNFWGAKIVARFTREQILAAVEQGRYSDPRTTRYLVDTLVERQRKTIRYWFERVNPLDRFEAIQTGEGYQLCFDDLSVKYRIANGETRYAARAFDREGRPTGWTDSAPGVDGGRACVDRLTPSKSRDGYTIVELRTGRSGPRLPPTLVHLALDPKRRTLRVIGLRRL